MRTFGRYRVTGELGAGAMGEVFEAVDEALGREVAVKTLRGGHTGLAAKLLDERFKLEARAIAKLAHPSVVQVFDIDLAADPPYLVMERVAGPSLKERLAKGPLDGGELRALGIQIANALAAAHEVSVLHRDVKPANILAAGPGKWKLADFGVAHVPDSSLTMSGQFLGSPAYAPPEALLRGQSGPEGDVFGLGATLYEAAVGKWPRSEATTAGLLAPVPPLAQLAPHVAADVAMAVDRALAIEPGDRPSAAAFAELLAGGSVPPLATAVAVATPAVPSRAKWWLVGAAIFGALLVLALVSSRDSGAPGVAVPAAKLPPPPGADAEQQRKLDEIVEKIDRGQREPAMHKLEEYEERYGASDQTHQLLEAIESLPEKGRGKGKKKKHDD